MRFLYFFLFLAGLRVAPTVSQEASTIPQTCAWEDRENCGDKGVYRDPHLVPMQVDLGDGTVNTVDVYVAPDIATYYNTTVGSKSRKETSFSGQFGKFINMSPTAVRVHWKNPRGELHYIADIAPFGGAGTATYPNHVFVVTSKTDSTDILHEWKMKRGEMLYKYDPIGSLEAAKKQLWASEFELYQLQHRNLLFDKAYRKKTGRQWLALYGRKHKPLHPIWPADSFGQTHTVETSETHFVDYPPDELAKVKVSKGKPTFEDQELRRKLAPYRTPNQDTLTLNMTVISVEPRAFEIRNFLSPEEVGHMMELATGIRLQRSTTRAGTAANARTNDSTRTSENSWIDRHQTPIVDAIYRRAADLLQIDEACFRHRGADEADIVPGSRSPNSERLQLVHYDIGQQYTPHHVSTK